MVQQYRDPRAWVARRYLNKMYRPRSRSGTKWGRLMRRRAQNIERHYESARYAFKGPSSFYRAIKGKPRMKGGLPQFARRARYAARRAVAIRAAQRRLGPDLARLIASFM